MRAEMEDVYGEEHVAAVNVAYNTDKLDPILAEYDRTKVRARGGQGGCPVADAEQPACWALSGHWQLCSPG